MYDEMPMNNGRQLGLFLLQFLHAALSEMPFAGFVRFAYRFDGLELAHAHERYARRHMRAYVPYVIAYGTHGY